MTSERWAEIEELFHRAAESDPKQRTFLLDEACNSDLELRREVEALLAGEERAKDDMKAAVHREIAAMSFPLVGQTILQYGAMDGLGSGGMGLVYRGPNISLEKVEERRKRSNDTLPT